MIYNKIIINLLVEFDFLGLFVFRKFGFYVFYFFFLVYLESRMWIEFFKNINYICFIFGYILYGYVDVGNFVFFYFNEYDIVSIKFYLFYDIIFYGIGD